MEQSVTVWPIFYLYEMVVSVKCYNVAIKRAGAWGCRGGAIIWNLQKFHITFEYHNV